MRTPSPLLHGALVALLLGAGLGACGPEKGDVERDIRSANHCDVPADCVDLGAYCPFGCAVLVNVDEATRIREAIHDYYDAHPGEQCLYDCVGYTGIACEAGVCVTQGSGP